MPLFVVLDTNFLLVPAQFGVDIFSETENLLEKKVEFIVLQSVIEELERKSKVKSKKVHFRIARDMVKRCTIVSVPKKMQMLPVDEQLLQFTKFVKGILATNDRDLRHKARKNSIPVLFLRGRKHFAVAGILI